MATERLEFISKPGNRLVFLLQGFGLKNRLPLGLGKVITTLVGDLMHRTGRTWLNPITLPRISVSTTWHHPVGAPGPPTLTFRCRHGLHESCGRLVFSRSGGGGGRMSIDG